MLYTLLFGFAAFILSFVIGSVFRIDNRNSQCFPSNFFMFVTFFTIIGAAIGFGYGTSRFFAGHYLPQ